MLTPLTIEIMLQCYCSPNPTANISERIWNSPAAKETREWLLSERLIDLEDRATDRGRAWVDFICSTPLPEMKWVMPAARSAVEAPSAEDATN